MTSDPTARDDSTKEPETSGQEATAIESYNLGGTLAAVVIGLALVGFVFWYLWGRESDISHIFNMARIEDSAKMEESRDWLESNWQDAYAPMLVELGVFCEMSTQEESKQAGEQIFDLLDRQMGLSLGHEAGAWQLWAWQQNLPQHEQYALFKSQLFGHIDSNFMPMLQHQNEPLIPLNQIVPDELVNFRQPIDFPALNSEENFLEDTDRVCGLNINGQARAYPLGLLIYHGLVRDELDGVPVSLVFCHASQGVFGLDVSSDFGPVLLGNSGLVRQSVRLLFDESTRSLWQPWDGRSVVGPATDSGSQLRALPVVVTDWNAWKTANPDTQVAGFETGYSFDYRHYERATAAGIAHQVSQQSDRWPDDQLTIGWTYEAQSHSIAISSQLQEFTQVDPFLVHRDSGNGVRVFGPADFSGVDLSHAHLQGNQLQVGEQSYQAIPTVLMTWKAWYANHPKTQSVELNSGE